LIFGSGDPAFDSFAEVYQVVEKLAICAKIPTLMFIRVILVRIQRVLNGPASKTLRSFLGPLASLILALKGFGLLDVASP
jgi:hypothetical protein